MLHQSQRGNYRVLYASLLHYPALILSHEMLAVYLPLLLLASSVAGTCLLMTVAIDWGRFITIIAIALFLLSFCFDPDRTARGSPAAAATAGSVTVSLRYALICAVYFVSWQVR